MDMMLNLKQARDLRLKINELLEGSQFILLFKDVNDLHILGNKVESSTIPGILEKTAAAMRASKSKGFDTE